MNTSPVTKPFMVQAIMGIRQEWETAARGDSLIDVNGSVGYLLADVARALGLSESKLKLALGDVADELTVKTVKMKPVPARLTSTNLTDIYLSTFPLL